MTPKGLMCMGASVGLVSIFVLVVGGVKTAPFIIPLFAGGAIFGKGYGIWEERNRGR